MSHDWLNVSIVLVFKPTSTSRPLCQINFFHMYIQQFFLINTTFKYYNHL